VIFFKFTVCETNHLNHHPVYELISSQVDQFTSWLTASWFVSEFSGKCVICFLAGLGFVAENAETQGVQRFRLWRRAWQRCWVYWWKFSRHIREWV